MKVKARIKVGKLASNHNTMVTTPGAARKAGRGAATATIGVVLAAIWIVSPLPAGAQALPNLVVGALSIYATMPDANGEQQVTASFQIVNNGTARASSSSTTVQSAGGSTILATPPLLPGATAFFSTTTTTTATDFTITVTAGNGNTASYHFVAASPALGRWRPIGPSVVMFRGAPEGVGRITTIAVDPSSTSTLYAGARASGLWKTTDGGAHWEPLTDALPTARIDAVAVDPNYPSDVFIATPAGVFGSTDGGHVWALLNGQDLQGQGNDGGAFIVQSFRPTILAANDAGPAAAAQAGPAAPGLLPPLPFSEVRLYLTTANGLRISRDGGVTWLPPVLGAGATIQSLVQDRSLPSHLLATVDASSTPGVYETFDGGLTPDSWQKLQGCPQAPLPTFPSTAAVWVAQSGATLWVSVKNGTQHDLWRSSGVGFCFLIAAAETSAPAPGILPILFGRTWQHLSSGDQTPCIGPGFNNEMQSESSFLKADPTNANILYKSGVNLCRSTDGGATFQEVTGIHVDQHALVFHPLVPSLLFLGNDGGLYRSGDGGQSWAFDAEGLSVTEFLDLDRGGAPPRVVVGGSQDNALSSTDLTSPVWEMVDLGADPDGDRTTAVVDPLDPTVLYTIGQAVNHLSRIHNGIRDGSPWLWEVGDNPTGVDPYNGLPEHCLAYSEWLPTLYTEFIATTNTDLHVLTTVGSSCGGGLWTGPPWYLLFAPLEGEAFTRVAFNPANGVFLAGGNFGSIYTVYFGAKVWQAPQGGSVTAIVPDVATTASYFVALDTPANAGAGTPANAGAGRIFEISPAGVLNFAGQDITGNLPPALVMTLASNAFEPGVLYAGTQGQGVFRGVRDATGQWSWQAFNNGMPPGAFVTKLRADPDDGTIYAATYGRGAFALDTFSPVIF